MIADGGLPTPQRSAAAGLPSSWPRAASAMPAPPHIALTAPSAAKGLCEAGARSWETRASYQVAAALVQGACRWLADLEGADSADEELLRLAECLAARLAQRANTIRAGAISALAGRR